MEWNLYEAADTGNVESLEEMVEKDSKLLKTVGMECLKPSPLHVAASRGHKDFVRKLLELNPELTEAIDSRRRTPLHLAVAKNHLDIVQDLVKVNREMCSARDIDGRNPLHVAALNGKGDVLEYLVNECHQAAQARVDRGETILHLWFKKLLLDHNNCQDLINAKDNDGNMGVLKFLLHHNNCQDLINAKDDDGNTILHLAAAKHDHKVVQRLVDCDKTNASPTNAEGKTPLDVNMAASQGHKDFVIMLLELNPELAEAIDSRRRTPLHLAVAKNHLDIVQELVEVNREMCSARDIDGRNPLHVAAMNGKRDVLEYLVNACPRSARARTDRGETILHLSFWYNHMEALKLLLDHNKCQDLVNAMDDDGNTILHLAVANHNYQVVKLLVSCDKTNASPTNAEGKTPLDVIETKLKMAQVAHGKKNKSSWQAYAKRAKQKPDDMIILCSAALGKANAKRAKHLGKVKWLTEKRDSLMVVASLIATMAFQAGVSPPGGVWADDSNGHRAGETVMAYNYPHFFPYFLRLNTVGFVGSLSTILLLISELPFKRKVFMWILVVIMWLTITSTAFTYSFAITVVTPMKYRASLTSTIKIGVLVWSCVMVVLLLVHTVRLMVKLIKEFKTKHYVSKSMKKLADAADAAAANAIAVEAPANV